MWRPTFCVSWRHATFAMPSGFRLCPKINSSESSTRMGASSDIVLNRAFLRSCRMFSHLPPTPVLDSPEPTRLDGTGSNALAGRHLFGVDVFLGFSVQHLVRVP